MTQRRARVPFLGTTRVCQLPNRLYFSHPLPTRQFEDLLYENA